MNILKETPPDIEEFYQYPFELDTFQKNAIISINKGHNVLITAHTGSGKSLVAEYAIKEGIKRGKKVIYTSPIKSLSNQKFYEFKQKFPDVGILTGDIKFNPTADCIIMTTEILRNLLYNKNIKLDTLEIEIDVYNEVEFVIFDEVHYINDKDRGSVWEECIMLLPNYIKLVMLSATIDRADRFALWINQIKDVSVDLIPNERRVIPLYHYYYLMKKVDNDDDDKYCNCLVEILDENNNYRSENYDSLLRLCGYNRNNDKKLIQSITDYLEKMELVPAIFFVFSRKKCEKYARYIEKSLITHEEYGSIKKIVGVYIHKLEEPQQYTSMKQYDDLMSYLEKGICIHHSGLVPVFKEIIEILFNKNLIKILFATETFAVGVNMPTKTTLFTSLKKYDGYIEDFRNLYTHEYLQMSGRAGRRGLDNKGVVIHLPNLYEPLTNGDMRKILTGRTQQIVSKFDLNYQLILKMILTNQINLINFIETSLMNKDIKEQKKRVISELDNIELDKITFDLEMMEEYYQIINPDPLFKITNRQIKQNRKRILEMRKVKDFDNQYKKYLRYKEQLDNKNKLEEELYFYQNVINQDITKIIHFLINHNYINEGEEINPERVTVKGIIASQINDCNPIILTEILINDILDDLTIPEIASILSILIDGKDNETTIISNKLGYRVSEKLYQIQQISSNMSDDEFRRGLDINSNWTLNLDGMDIAYEWASGKKLKELSLTVYEGNFIKEMIKINNIALNVQKMSEMLGKTELSKKAEELQTIMMRDIVNVDSLYIKN